MRIPNPLDKFTTWSAHYMLLAARSSEDIRGLLDKSREAECLAAINKTKHLGNEVVLGNERNSVFLLADTRRFSQFTIDNLNIESTFIAFNGNGTPNSFASGLSFQVIDSVGVSFIQFLKTMMDVKLQCSLTGLIFVLRLVFVGEDDNGKTETIQSCSIPFFMNTVNLDLTDVKGVYDIVGHPMMNLSEHSTMARLLRIGPVAGFYTGKGANTLGAVIKAFESDLNYRSISFYNKLQQEYQTATGAKPADGRYGRYVTYLITLPQGWADFKWTGGAPAAAQEIDHRKNAKKTELPTIDAHIGTKPDSTISAVLDGIFAQVHELNKMANITKAKPGEDIKLYKYVTSTTSTKETVQVHVDVVEFILPNVMLKEQQAKEAAARKGKTTSQSDTYTHKANGATEPHQFYEYDYIFSGINKDILHLDLKFSDLLMFLSMETRLGTDVMNTVSQNGVTSNDKQPESKSIITTSKKYDIVPLPMQGVHEKNNFSKFSSSLGNVSEVKDAANEYLRTLTAFYGLQQQQVNVTLRGNPAFLTGLNVAALPQHVPSSTNNGTTVSTLNSAARNEYRKDFEKRIAGTDPFLKLRDNGSVEVTGISEHLTTPIFFKINVRGPNVQFWDNAPVTKSNPGDPDPAATIPIMSDNYYFAASLKSTISGGVFTQDIALKGYSVYGAKTMGGK